MSRKPGQFALLAGAVASALGFVPPALAQEVPLLPTFEDVALVNGTGTVYLPSATFSYGIQPIHIMGAGAAVGDFDRDGWQDLFVVTGGSRSDCLFMNNRDGTFANKTAQAGLETPHYGMSVAVGDYDADGWLDIFVMSIGTTPDTAATGRHFLWRNNGDMTFTDVAAQAGVQQGSTGVPDGLGSAFGDYDLDGDLDLFVAAWILNSDGNRLYRNEGDGTFTDVTVAAGVHELGIRGFSPRFVDMDGDRWPELLLAADFGTSRYYVNERDGTFTEFTVASGTGLDGNGMGHTTGDFDGNGLLDWYVTSIYSLDSGSSDIPGTGNMLYLNNGGHQYTEASVAAGVRDGGWGWGTVAVDVNNDGLLDIAETNGFKQYTPSGGLEWVNEQAYLWINKGDGTFSESALASGFEHYTSGRGLIHFDGDNDGDQDLVVLSNKGRLAYFRNQSDLGHHFLRVGLDTNASPYLAPDGFGTRVVAVVLGKELVRVIDGGSTFLSQPELFAHFGLRGAERVEELRVEWNNGRVTYLSDLPADQHLVVAFCPGDWNGTGGITDADYDDFRLDYAAGAADFNGDGVTDPADFIEFQAAWLAGCP